MTETWRAWYLESNLAKRCLLPCPQLISCQNGWVDLIDGRSWLGLMTVVDIQPIRRSGMVDLGASMTEDDNGKRRTDSSTVARS